MPDLSLDWGGDLTLGPSGGLALASGTALAQQRLIRRLLTNPGAYIWHPAYGAGLARFVGEPGQENAIVALVREQMAQEASVAQSPQPAVNLSWSPDGTYSLRIRYADTATGEARVLSLPVRSQ